MYDRGGKLYAREIKSIYVDCLPCVRVKGGGESEWIKIDCGLRQGYIMSLSFQCIYGRSDEVGEDEDGKERSEGYLASCMQMTWFIVVSRMRT